MSSPFSRANRAERTDRGTLVRSQRVECPKCGRNFRLARAKKHYCVRAGQVEVKGGKLGIRA